MPTGPRAARRARSSAAPGKTRKESAKRWRNRGCLASTSARTSSSRSVRCRPRERGAEDAGVVEAEVALHVLGLRELDALRREHVVEGREVNGLAVHQHTVEIEERREHHASLPSDPRRGPVFRVAAAREVERHDDGATEARLEGAGLGGVAVVMHGEGVRARDGSPATRGVGPAVCLPSTVTTAPAGTVMTVSTEGRARRAWSSRSASARSCGREVLLREVLLDGAGGGLGVVHALAAPRDVPQFARGSAEAVRREEVADGVGEAGRRERRARPADRARGRLRDPGLLRRTAVPGVVDVRTRACRPGRRRWWPGARSRRAA